MNSLDSRAAETVKANRRVVSQEPSIATLSRALVDRHGEVVAYASDNGALVDADGAIIGSGLTKQACRAATTANVTIATALNNGDTLDGVLLATGDRVLVKNQTDPTQNGIYVVAVSPARATDFDGWSEIPGSVVSVLEGTANEGVTYICSAAESGVLDTDDINFTPYPSGAGFTSPKFTTDIRPSSNDGAAIGTTTLGFSDIHLATGATINVANGNAVITHSSAIFTVSTGDLRVTTAGTNAASVVTVGGTQTLTNKTLTSPTITKAAVARTATADGLTTGIIADAGWHQHITVTSGNADHIVVLPTPTPGVEVVLDVGANGFELRSSAPATVAINGGSGASAESAIPANSTVVMTCVSATSWKGFFMDADGDVAKVEAAA